MYAVAPNNDPNSRTVDITIAGQAFTIAQAGPPSYTLSVARAGTGTGTVSVSPNQSSYASGTQVILTATAAYGSAFTGWSGACSGVSTTCTLTMYNDQAMTANFMHRTGSKGHYAGRQ